MINKIRKMLLVLAISLVLIAGYYLYLSQQKLGIQLKLHTTEKGMDVVIENFKVVHENEGRTDWELRAKSAQINNKYKITYLKTVDLTLDLSEDQKYWITANNGTLNNDTQDINLEGSVKLIARSKPFRKKTQPEESPSKR